MTQLSRREALAMQEPAKEQTLQGKIDNAHEMYELCKRHAVEFPHKSEHWLAEAEQERLKLEALIVQQATEVYGPDWELDADRLHDILEAEKMEIRETLAIFGPAHLTPNLSLVQSAQRVNMLVASGAVNSDGSLKPYVASGHRSTPMTFEELGDDGQGYFNEARNG